ncbi:MULTISPECIES: hypothetical protein [Bacteroides]|uniref:Putative tail fiber protein gp53-like C-terminal domain-containing protein n=1 Tax=Bacteroides difficilis TaxID=2763021 RepID=A0ABR7CDP6_9BACE|nr:MULTISPECIES: hypothetical protein [Bacteroides]MBC5605858.1 hypothetical protein [Bacteroides difficilis]
MAGEKYNIQLEAVEIFNRLIQVPQLAEGLSDLLQNFNSHNHDIRNDKRYQPLGDYQPLGNYAASVHEHQASDIQETTDKKVMTAEERNILSTLGTTYAKADLSNAVTTLTSGNNTYIKFNNGILIQYGRITTTGQKERRVYMPTSFKNDGYKVFYGIEAGADVVQTLYTLNKSTSSFYVSGTFYDPYNGSKGFPGESFDWFAIGIWK